MKALLFSLMGIFAGLAVAASEGKYHDPFWPIGYAPAVIEPEPEPEQQSEEPQEAVAAEPEQKRSPRSRLFTNSGVSAASPKAWADAKKLLKVNGVTRSRKIGQREGQLVVFINGKSYSNGDVVTLEHGNIRFSWKLRSGNREKTYELKMLKAERLDAPREK